MTCSERRACALRAQVNLDGYALPIKKLKGTEPVESLDLSHKGLGVASAIVIASLIGVNGGLTKISLAGNILEEEGTKAICEALEQNTTLKELDISGHREYSNIGGSAGAKHVAKMVRVNGALTSVKLGGNKLGDEGWGAIFAAICGNKDSKIMCLDASSETIGPAGVKLIAEALRTSATGALTECNLRNNSSMGEAVQASIRNAVHMAVQGKAWFTLRL